MEAMDETYAFASSLTIGSDLTDYCNFLYGFAALCEDQLTLATITSTEIAANNLLMNLGINWSTIQTELEAFWETFDWSPCEMYYASDPTSLATCKAFMNDNVMPANARQFGMTQCFTTCDMAAYTKMPSVFKKDCIFPSWYQYDKKINVDESTFEAIF